MAVNLAEGKPLPRLGEAKGVVLTRVPRSGLDALSSRLHEDFRRCGGFIAHESLEEGLAEQEGTEAGGEERQGVDAVDRRLVEVRPEVADRVLRPAGEVRLTAQPDDRHHQHQLLVADGQNHRSGGPDRVRKEHSSAARAAAVREWGSGGTLGGGRLLFEQEATAAPIPGGGTQTISVTTNTGTWSIANGSSLRLTSVP